MNILKQILEEAFLLREDASVDAINNAVNNMRPVTITYRGESGGGLGEREIYPVAYGISTAGNPVVRAFQPKGATSSEVPGWKFFRVDRIDKWENDNSRTFNPEELNGFNENGDEQIETLYAISPIGAAREKQTEKEPEKQAEPEKKITSHPINKGEVDNGGADANTEKQYYSANDVVKDILNTSNPKISPAMNKNIDNFAGQDDISKENQPAREPVPVTKQEITGSVPVESPEEKNDNLFANNGPVTKNDVDNEKVEPDTLGTAANDLTRRMNNLYNDNEEEEEI